MIAALKRNLGSAVFGLLRVLYKPREKPDLAELGVERVLLVQGLRIGDAVATLPAIDALHQRWPAAEIVAIAPPPAAEILAMSGLVRRTEQWPVEGRRLGNGKRAAAELGKIDVAVVFDCTLTSMLVADSAQPQAMIGYDSFNRGFGLTHPARPPSYWNLPVRRYSERVPVRTQGESWCRMLRDAGIEAEPTRPVLRPARQDQRWADKFLRPSSGRPLVALHPGAEASYRWLPERWAAVGDALAKDQGAALVLTGGPGDGPVVDAVAESMQTRPLVAAAQTTLGQMAALLESADLLLGVDTSAGHIAAAVGTPVVSLFGPGDASIWAPQGERVTVLTAPDCDCLGCKRAECKRRDHPCMSGITVDAVLAAAREMLDGAQ